jgi:hypothetical protein
MFSCSICFHTSTRSFPVSCPSCDLKTCTGCTRKSLVCCDGKCSGCSVKWTEAYIRQVCSSTWVASTWTAHLKQRLLLEQEMLMSETSEFITPLVEMRKCEAAYKEAHERYYLNSVPYKLSLLTKTEKTQTLIAPILHSMKDHPKIIDARLNLQHARAVFESDKSSWFTTYREPGQLRTLCIKEGCKGFLTVEGKCAVCETVACLSCLCELTSLHQCLPENVEAVQLIKKLTHPCPGCTVPIVKSEGCDHMFCPQCKCGFSWATGKVIPNSQNTNPLFYKWQRDNVEVVAPLADTPPVISLESFKTLLELELEINIYEVYSEATLFVVDPSLLVIFKYIFDVADAMDEPYSPFDPLKCRYTRMLFMLDANKSKAEFSTKMLAIYKKFSSDEAMFEHRQELRRKLLGWLPTAYEHLQNWRTTCSIIPIGTKVAHLVFKKLKFEEVIEWMEEYTVHCEQNARTFGYSAYCTVKLQDFIDVVGGVDPEEFDFEDVMEKVTFSLKRRSTDVDFLM